MIGLVIKKKANNFWVECNNQKYVCTAQKKLKENGIFVGDYVNFDKNQKQILGLEKRKNKMLRPPVANIDALVILLTSTPKADFYLLDKLILFCKLQGIEPIICHSKIDLNQNNTQYLYDVYGKYFCVTEVSAKSGNGLENLKHIIAGKTTAFAGQSGVGKSALLNALLGTNQAQEGTLSNKINRGKNTTRHAELFCIAPHTYLADTAGFSSLDEKFLDLKAEELSYYYPEFVECLPNCKFKSCTHIHEPDCAVQKAINNGLIDIGRYERYKLIFENLKQK